MSKKRTCPRCGFELDNGETTCPSCGCQVPIEVDTHRCPKCKQKLDPLDDICPNCGMPVKRNLESRYESLSSGEKIGNVFLKGVVGAAVDSLDSGGDANVTYGDVVRFQNRFNDIGMKKGVHYEKKGSYYRFDSGGAPEGAKKAALKAQKRVLTSKTASVMRKTFLPGVILMAIALTAGILFIAEEFTILPCIFATLIAAPSIAVAIGNFMVYRSAKDPARDCVSSSGISVIKIALCVRMALTAIAVIVTLIADWDTAITLLTAFSGVFLIPSDICSVVCLKRLQYEFDTRNQTPGMMKYGMSILAELGIAPGHIYAIMLVIAPEVPFALRILAVAAFLTLGIYANCAGKLLTDYHNIMLSAIERELRREAEEEPDPEPQTPKNAPTWQPPQSVSSLQSPKNAPCPKCGAANDLDSLFCMTCGTKLEKPAEKVDRPNFCPYCGSKLAPDSAFCSSCGRKL